MLMRLSTLFAISAVFVLLAVVPMGANAQMLRVPDQAYGPAAAPSMPSVQGPPSRSLMIHELSDLMNQSGLPSSYLPLLYGLPDTQVSQVYSEVQAAKLVTFDQSAFEYATAGLAGCGIGAVVGIAGGPIGMGAGCVGGAIGGLLVAYVAGQTASNQNPNELPWLLQNLNYLGNSMNVTATDFRNALADLNKTLGALSNQVAHAALAQLGNTSFDALRALNESGVLGELTTFTNTWAHTVGQSFAVLNTAVQYAYGPGAAFHTGSDGIIDTGGAFCLGANFECGTNLNYYTHVTGYETITVNSSGPTYVYILPGAQFSVSAAGTLYLVGGGYATSPSGQTDYKPFPGPGGVYRVTTGSSMGIVGYGILGAALGGNRPATTIEVAACGANGATCDILQPTVAVVPPTTLQIQSSGTPHSFAYPFGGNTQPAWRYAYKEMNQLEVSAANVGLAYWTFLKLLGFNSTSQIPSNCIIPTPDQALSASQTSDLNDLSFNNTYATYLAWMNGLATFFNTPLNSTNFCSGHAVFKLQDVSFTNPRNFLSGFILTVPVAPQQLSTRSTWTVNGTYNAPPNSVASNPALVIIAWPTTQTVSIVMNTVWEVPQNDPFTAVTPKWRNATTLESLFYYSLSGNGTNVVDGQSNGLPASSTPGAALYITGCTMNGTTTTSGNCRLLLSTLGGFLSNQTGCGAPCAPVFGGFSSCGITFPVVAQIVAFWDSITNGLPFGLGCPVAEVLALLTIVVLIVVVFYVMRFLIRRD